ncbi:hypothetical protein [Dictyobacter kobayashii]|uniref:Uncharacterized protein n=1 Tax=Dictyobacter kobayashii TaxID=2014872 RepID=A0A402AE30_9CHLR|nr:hypothetical protein [Dictyobacter kobayashii]GCE17360.1 hypothetical protein KDK_11600 [Dictyobacter kobayashii]
MFAHTLAPAAVQQLGLFEPELVQSIQQRAAKEPAAARALIFIFTTQLLSQLFNIDSWA